ncbi:MAG: hypothetical protein NPIRA02_42070 [Nitrospirales bacterium]|nr:MAG: hypothetical protein NPIRA02_42070 [Nitrospirales bacterium]
MDLANSPAIELHLVDLTCHKSLVQKWVFYVVTWTKVFFQLRDVHVVSFQAPYRKYVATFGPFLFLMAKFWKKPIVLRQFAGDCHIIFRKYPRVLQWIQRKTILNADLSFYQTKYQIEFFEPLVTNPVKWFPTNRKIPVVQKQRWRNTAQKFVFLGWVMEDKGVRVLIDAFKLIEADVSVDIYGHDRMNINSLIKNEKNIEYKGVIDNKLIYQTLIQYDALILPTHWRGEGYPGAIIEAFSVGLPVIATSLPGIKELVKQGETGLLIDPKNVESLQAAVISLNRNAELYQHMIHAVQKEKHWLSSEYWADEFESEISKLLTHRQNT